MFHTLDLFGAIATAAIQIVYRNPPLFLLDVASFTPALLVSHR